jgi:hypothetical protein
MPVPRVHAADINVADIGILQEQAAEFAELELRVDRGAQSLGQAVAHYLGDGGIVRRDPVQDVHHVGRDSGKKTRQRVEGSLAVAG